MTQKLSQLWIDWVVVAILCVVPFWLTLQYQQGYAYDDAFITLTYARNLAEGKGFVYNGGPEYLGTTTPLLALILAALQLALPSGDLQILAVWFGALMWAFTIILAYLVGKRLVGRAAGLVCAVIIATTPIYPHVQVAEFPLLICLSLAAIYLAVIKRYWLAGTALGMAFLTRGDAALLAGLVGLAILVKERKIPWGLGFGFLIPVIPWSIYSFLTFGNPLPATLSTKLVHRDVGAWPPITTGFRQWIMETGWWFRARLFLTAGISSIALFYYIWSKNVWAIVVILWGTAYAVAYVVLDVPFYFWYTAVLFVSMALGSGLAMGSLFQDGPPSSIHTGRHNSLLAKLTAFCLFVAVVSIGIKGLEVVSHYLAEDADPKKEAYIKAATWLNENTPVDSTVGFIEVGWVGYYSRRQIIDLLGLVTPGLEPYLVNRDHVGLFQAVQPDYYIRNRQFDGWGINSAVQQSYFFVTSYAPIHEIEQRNARPITLYQRRTDVNVEEFPEAADLAGRVARLPGEHVSLAGTPPSDYLTFTPEEVRELHDSGVDIWLHVPMGDYDESEQVLINWLLRKGAVKLQVGEYDIFWLAGHPDVDYLVLVRDQGLLSFIQTDQLKRLWLAHGDHMRHVQAFNDAVFAYRQVLVRRPGPEDSYAALGLAAALLGLGRHQEALPYLESSVETFPEDFWAHRLLGNTYAHVGRFQEAEEELVRALEINSDDASLVLDVARAQMRIGKKSEALQTLDLLSNRTDIEALSSDIEALRQSLQE